MLRAASPVPTTKSRVRDRTPARRKRIWMRRRSRRRNQTEKAAKTAVRRITNRDTISSRTKKVAAATNTEPTVTAWRTRDSSSAPETPRLTR